MRKWDETGDWCTVRMLKPVRPDPTRQTARQSGSSDTPTPGPSCVPMCSRAGGITSRRT
jgi:hypothetical protein